MSDYRALAADGETLKPGMESERILMVRQRLIRSGDLSSGSPHPRRYDQDLQTAVKRFQKRYHLETDGAIGKKTVVAMNIPISRLFRRITINMERWRWLSPDLGLKNSLASIKFMFPNAFNVYLHDTPTQHLFKRSRRDFSDGCIRVSRPLELASYLLGGAEKGWGIERMKKIIERGIGTPTGYRPARVPVQTG
ncbi:MAG: L,D-transpeptidase family protein [Methylococcales bacterium]